MSSANDQLRKESALNRLTSKQQQFAQLVARGQRYVDAYRSAYNSNGKPGTVRVEASRLANANVVREAIQDIQEKLYQTERQNKYSIVDLLVQEARSTASENKRLRTLLKLGRVVGQF